MTGTFIWPEPSPFGRVGAAVAGGNPSGVSVTLPTLLPRSLKWSYSPAIGGAKGKWERKGFGVRVPCQTTVLGADGRQPMLRVVFIPSGSVRSLARLALPTSGLCRCGGMPNGSRWKRERCVESHERIGSTS